MFLDHLSLEKFHWSPSAIPGSHPSYSPLLAIFLPSEPPKQRLGGARHKQAGREPLGDLIWQLGFPSQYWACVRCRTFYIGERELRQGGGQGRKWEAGCLPPPAQCVGERTEVCVWGGGDLGAAFTHSGQMCPYMWDRSRGEGMTNVSIKLRGFLPEF